MHTHAINLNIFWRAQVDQTKCCLLFGRFYTNSIGGADYDDDDGAYGSCCFCSIFFIELGQTEVYLKRVISQQIWTIWKRKRNYLFLTSSRISWTWAETTIAEEEVVKNNLTTSDLTSSETSMTNCYQITSLSRSLIRMLLATAAAKQLSV